MRDLIIIVHIRPLDLRQTLQLHLQGLGYIVADSQADFWVEHDVDFDGQTGAAVPGADRIDLSYERVVVHRDVREMLEGFGIGGLADQHVEFGGCGAQPEEGDEDAEDDGAGGVDPPAEFGAAD